MGKSKTNHVYERASTLGVCAWFFCKYWFRLTSRVLLVILVLWFLFFGGVRCVMGWFTNGLVRYVTRGNVARKEKQSKVSSVSSDGLEGSSSVNGVSPDLGVNSNPYRVVLLSGDSCVLANGFVYQVGDLVDGIGKKVVSFDLRRRCVVLDDGVYLWMREYSRVADDGWARADKSSGSDKKKRGGQIQE